MEAQVIRAAVTEVLRQGVSLSPSTWVYLIIGVLAASVLGAYLAHKGRNLATREDVGEITRRVEEVKAAFSAQIEERAQENRLRLAALEKRLDVHQQAYVRWRKLLSAVHTDQIGNVVAESQRWWIENCLYLTAEVREAFVDAWLAAHRHSSLLRADTSKDELYKNWHRLEECGEVILRSAGLPGFSPHEREDVAKLGAKANG
jgi:hypothetical protein